MIIKKDGRGQNYINIKIPKRVSNISKWCDNDHLMFIAMGMLFEDYFVGEVGGIDSQIENIEYAKKEVNNKDLSEWDRSYWKYDIPLQEEVLRLYKMWIALPKYAKRIEKKYLYESEGNMWFYYEDLIHQLEDQFMRRLIDVRLTLWT